MSPLSVADEFSRRMGNRAGLGAPLRRDFVLMKASQQTSPLGSLMNSRSGGGGGRGGGTRHALVVTCLWVCSARPYQSQRSARWWAEMIGLADPGKAGSRTVRSNFQELESRGFLIYASGKRQGLNPIITLCNEAKPHETYELPAEAGDSYFRIPDSLWRRPGILGGMDGSALAMYLILLHYYRQDRSMGDGTWFAAGSFAERHGMSEATKNKGLDRLVDLGVARVHEKWLDGESDTGNGYRSFRRRYYNLDPVFCPPPPSARPRANAPSPSNVDQRG